MRRSVEICIGNMDSEYLLSGLKILEECIHSVVYVGIGRSGHRASEETMSVQDSNLAHGCWVRGVGKESHPCLGKTVFGVANSMSHFNTRRRCSGRRDGNDTNRIIIVVISSWKALGVGI